MMEPIKYTLQAIPNGKDGTRATLKIMSRVVRQYRKNPNIRELALKLTQDLPSKKWLGEVSRIHEFVRDHIRYVKDIYGCETIQTPLQTLRLKAGDCDDKTILVASLLQALGHPVKIVAVGPVRGMCSHVLPYTKIGGKWIAVETTEPWPLGKGPTQVKTRMVENV